MAEPYYPLYYNWIEDTKELTDAEKGRLIDAIVLFARGEDGDSRITGNERYCFPMYKSQLRRSRKTSNVRAEAGSKGGAQTQANINLLKQNNFCLSNEKMDQSLLSKNDNIKKKKKKEEEYKEKEKEEEADSKSSREEHPDDDSIKAITFAPASTASSSSGLDGLYSDQEIEEARMISDQAETLAKKYGIAINSRTLDAIEDDIRANGAEAVEAALITASESDNRGGISIRYYRAILNNKKQGKAPPGRSGKEADPEGFIHHTDDEWKRAEQAVMVNLFDDD